MKVTDTELAVLRALCVASGTWDQVSQRSGLRPSSISPRFRPLERRGLIERLHRTKVGSKRARQTVWHLTEAGHVVVRAEAGRELRARPAVFYVPQDALPPEVLKRPLPPGQVLQVLPPVTPAMIDALSDEQWRQVLGGNLGMKGFVRIRAKRLLRLLTEGKVYDDETEKPHWQARIY